MFSLALTHIWGFRAAGRSFLAALILLLFAQCGLPEFAVVAKPSKLTNSDTLKATVIGFQTPSNDTNITGYALYYKIYISDSEYNTDESYFEDGHYVNSDTEFQPGSVVPKSRGFVLAGHLGATDLPESRYTIRHSAAGDDILINFNPNDSNTDSNARQEPVVVKGPLSANNPTLHTLARGFVDYRSASGNQLRRFVDDWYFQQDFTDGDLGRPPAKQPGSQAADYPGNFQRLAIVNRIIIGFVVHSVGYNPATSSPLVSQPVSIGKIEYTEIRQNSARLSGS